MFNDIRLKRREELIKTLRNRIDELEKLNVDAAVVKDKQVEADALIYRLNELLSKMSNELRELEKARHNYETERNKFVILNANYKKQMEKFFNKLNGKEES